MRSSINSRYTPSSHAANPQLAALACVRAKAQDLFAYREEALAAAGDLGQELQRQQDGASEILLCSPSSDCRSLLELDRGKSGRRLGLRRLLQTLQAWQEADERLFNVSSCLLRPDCLYEKNGQLRLPLFPLDLPRSERRARQAVELWHRHYELPNSFKDRLQTLWTCPDAARQRQLRLDLIHSCRRALSTAPTKAEPARSKNKFWQRWGERFFGNSLHRLQSHAPTEPFPALDSGGLALLEARQSGERYYLLQQELWIGRDPSLCEWSLADPKLGRRHARIVRRPDKKTGLPCYWLQDLDSKNGSFINGRRLRSNECVCLQNRDEILLGSSWIHFTLPLSKKDRKNPPPSSH